MIMEDDNYKYTLPERIASSIEKKILDGEYRIGSKLPTEPQLSELFNVSRGTIREALNALSSAGLLESRQGSGTYVKARERLEVAIRRALDSTEEKDMIEVKNMLEKHASAVAALNRTDADLRKMKSYLDDRNSSEEEYLKAEDDRSFHLTIAEATHNPLLSSLYRYVSEYLYEIEEEYEEKRISSWEMDELHELLCKAIDTEDANMAERIMDRILKA